jgi:hypothetical protein
MREMAKHGTLRVANGIRKKNPGSTMLRSHY